MYVGCIECLVSVNIKMFERVSLVLLQSYCRKVRRMKSALLRKVSNPLLLTRLKASTNSLTYTVPIHIHHAYFPHVLYAVSCKHKTD